MQERSWQQLDFLYRLFDMVTKVIYIYIVLAVWSSGILGSSLRTTHQIVEALTHFMASILAVEIILTTLILLVIQIL